MKILRIPFVIILLVVAGWAFNANAQTETNLHLFGILPNDGASSYAGLVQGSDGNFYGTTYSGGTINSGTVFRINSGGTYTNLYSFGRSPTDGANPQAGLVQGTDGNFYGTTAYGGTTNDGTVFRISPSGTYTSLYSFVGYPTDGGNPSAGLVQGSDGNFYGTTESGGAGYGTVFRISGSGSETNLHSFTGFLTDGFSPNAGLVQSTNGNFYGTTQSGGTNTCRCGSVFRISSSGSETILHFFGSSPTDGVNPQAGLVQGSDGNFYGTTEYGGTTNDGTVFRISPGGSYTSIYSFVGPPTDGIVVYARLVQGSDGNLYGTTYGGGMYDEGIVFRISSSGSETNLYSFGSQLTDGGFPEAGLVQGSDGNFYGTTLYGGTNNEGTVFELTVPLNPPANQISGIHRAGTNAVIVIPSVAYETYQLQYRNSLTSGTWSNVPNVSITNSVGALLTLTNFGGALQPQGFYRFDITP